MWSKKKKLCLGAVLISAIIVILAEFFFNKDIKSTYVGGMIYEIIIRAAGILASVALIIFLGYKSIFRGRITGNKLRGITFVAISFVIAVNNFPFISVALGDVYVRLPFWNTLLYAMLCLAVSAFEEFAFRGVAFMLVLERSPKNRKGAFFAILISSLLFGVIHSVNIFAGAGVGSVILQIGYSSLIGALSAVMLIKTGNIFYSVALHALYNFNGGLVPRFGTGIIWTTEEIVFTAVVSVFVTIYVIWEFFGTSDEKIKNLFGKGSVAENDNP